MYYFKYFINCKALILKPETVQVDVVADAEDSQQKCSTSCEVGDFGMCSFIFLEKVFLDPPPPLAWNCIRNIDYGNAMFEKCFISRVFHL